MFRSSRSSLLSSCSSVTQRPTEYKTWDKDSMGKACRDIREGRLSIRRAAESYQVPKSTLSDHVTGRVSEGSHSGVFKDRINLPCFSYWSRECFCFRWAIHTHLCLSNYLIHFLQHISAVHYRTKHRARGTEIWDRYCHARVTFNTSTYSTTIFILWNVFTTKTIHNIH